MSGTNVTLPNPDDEARGNRLQGWVQTDKAAHKSMWQLGVKHPTALTVLHFMVSKMQRGTNGIVMSAQALSDQIGISSRTVQSAISVLRDSKFVQVLKSGNTNVYIINSQVAWQGSRGFRYASFNAQITVSENEQGKTVEELQAESREMIGVPVMHISGGPDEEIMDIEMENESSLDASESPVITDSPEPKIKVKKVRQGKLKL
jgi:tetrahydromethanopterin S-methyltransferase subunit H